MAYRILRNKELFEGLKIAELEKEWIEYPKETTPAPCLVGLIRRAYEKTGQRVVVLIDEYDKPLISTMDKPKLNEKIREILK